MAITFLDPTTAATFDLTFANINTGTVESDSTGIAKYGPRCYKFGGSGGAAPSNTGRTDSAMARLVGRSTAWYRFPSLPTGGSATLAVVTDVGGNGVWLLQLSTAGKLGFANDSGSSKPGGATLSTNTWYRITVATNIISTTNWSAKVYVTSTDGAPGVLDIAADSGDFALTTVTNERYFSGNLTANTFILFVNGVYIDDVSDLSDPGDIRVTAKRPFSNGTTNDFNTQIGSGGSGYGSGHSPQVNERPLSTTNGWSKIGAGAAVTEEYNVEGQSVGDIDVGGKTIIGKVGWVYASSALAETGKIIIDGVSSDIALTSTNTFFYKVSGTATYPAGTGADVGIITSTTLTTVSLYEAGVVVAYAEPQTGLGGNASKMLLLF